MSSRIVYSQTLLKDIPQEERGCIFASQDRNLFLVDKAYNHLWKRCYGYGSYAKVIELEPWCGMVVISHSNTLHQIHFFDEVRGYLLLPEHAVLTIGESEVLLSHNQHATYFNGRVSANKKILASLTRCGYVISAHFSKSGRMFTHITGHRIFQNRLSECFHQHYDEQIRVAHLIIVDICIAMASAELPNYVLLEIIDWIECIYPHCHRRKIALIEAVAQSIRKIKEKRNEHC